MATPDRQDGAAQPPATHHPGPDGEPAAGSAADHTLRTVLEGVERDLILGALRETRGNKAKAARSLGITERLMGIRVKKLGIDWRGLRAGRRRGDPEA